MNVLSLFDGISVGQLALKELDKKVDNYYASEIDKYAIKVTQNNFPKTIQLGDIKSYKEWGIDFDNIDIVIGGSPCQSISNLGDGTGLNGKSSLFFYFYEILNRVKPKYFLLENVVGNKKSIEKITELMGVTPIKINSAIFSAQNRNRLYWTNIPIDEINNLICDIKLRDILEPGIPKESILSDGRMRWITSEKGLNCIEKKYASLDPEKASCLTARSDASWNSNYVTRNGQITRLTPIEYERLQTLPDNYTLGISNSQRYKSIGNSWTKEVIKYIFKNI